MTERPPPADRGSLLWKRWREVDRLFEAVLDVSGPHRAAFLRDRCAGDTELLNLVAELLEIAARADPPLERPSDAMMRAALRRSERGAAAPRSQRIDRGETGRGSPGRDMRG